MSAWVRWLLGDPRLHPDDAGVDFGFAHPLPSWGWALLVLGAGTLAWWSYRRLQGPVGARAALALLRAALLLVLGVLLAGPRLVRVRETLERDWVLVLVDRSESMAIEDVRPDGAGAPVTSREAQLRAALAASAPVWADIGRERELRWLGFDLGAYDVDPGALGAPRGRRTYLGRALGLALGRAAARPVSGIVVLSDGRSDDTPDRALLRRLGAERIPVFAVPLGSAQPPADIAVRRVDAPRTAFINDIVPVEVELTRVGPGGAGTVGVELVDAGGNVLDRREVAWPEPDAAGVRPPARVTLRTSPASAGDATWRVRVASAGDDLLQGNNTGEVTVRLLDQPVRVLYIDGYPRWEYRYLKNVLVREPSVQAAAMLLAPGRRYLQEGLTEVASLPSSPEEWGVYDVVVIGDVVPDVFTPDQLGQLRDHVALRGAGLLWIGGEGATPAGWRASPLADLLPMRPERDGPGRIGAWGAPVHVRPSPAADRLGVLRLDPFEASGWPAALGDAEVEWSALRWAQRIPAESLKPAAEVLANAVSADGQAAPVMLTMRFGAGRIAYVATDEVWRWRYGRGEDYPERFWLQLVRLLGRESAGRAGQGARLVVTPTRAQVETPVRVEVELVDQSLLDAAPSGMSATVRRAAAEGEDGVIQLPLRQEGGSSEAGPAALRRLAGTFVPATPGRYTVEVADALLAGERLRGEVDVWLPDAELARPEANHDLLRSLAEATDGRVLTPDRLAELPQLLPNRAVRVMGTPEEDSLWDTPLALLAVIVLLTGEWVGRRLLRLA